MKEVNLRNAEAKRLYALYIQEMAQCFNLIADCSLSDGMLKWDDNHETPGHIKSKEIKYLRVALNSQGELRIAKFSDSLTQAQFLTLFGEMVKEDQRVGRVAITIAASDKECCDNKIINTGRHGLGHHLSPLAMEMNKRGVELQKINLDVAHFDRRVTTEAMNSASPEYGEGKGVVQNAVMYPTDQSLRDHREIVISTPEKFNLSHAAQRALKASASYESMDDTVKAEVDNKTILAGIKESTLERRTCNGLEASKALVDGFAKIDLRVQEKAASRSRAKASLYKTSFTKQMENAKIHLANNCTEWPPSSKQGTSHVESVFASSNQILGWNTGLELAHCSILLHFVHYLLGKRRGNCKFIANFSADRIRGGYPETGHDAFYLEEEICAIFRSLGMAVPAGYERVISSPPTKLTFAVPLAYLRSAFRAFQFATPAQPAERMQLSVGPVHNELTTVPMVTVSKSMTPPAATASQNPLMMMFQQHQTNQAPVLGGQPAFKRRQVTREEGHPIDPNTMAISATAVASSASTASATTAGAAIACGGQQSIAAFAGSKKRPIQASASSNERKLTLDY
ncbi:hypothetical protein CYMTET_43175 [Cymbomonas tetramitiformis]|uniref:Uncharacterized protein n=1 Tax=Cymbomonas tetramitiformis TaxID=36881 RepID=A0AAE0C2K3_9CHLO|nr:hypothetical protein CYMTET_43175 [Cymbomonas tetramitiformis]